MRKQSIAKKITAAALILALVAGGAGVVSVSDSGLFSASAAAGDIELSETFGFKENDDGTYSVFSCDLTRIQGSEIVIPDTCAGVPVTAVRSGLFDGYTSEGSYDVVIGKNISTIEEYAFDGIKIDNVSVAEGNSSFTEAGNMLYTGDMKTLVYCPSNFQGRAAIATGAHFIREDAFSSDGIDEIYIGHDIEQLPEDAFLRCTGVKKFTLNSKNKNFCIVKGSVLDRTKTTFLAYPKGREPDYSLPSTVKKIAPYAFAYSKIQTVKLGNVSEIGSHAFEGCGSLGRVTITSTSQQIGEGAFEACTGLTDAVISEGIQSVPADLFKGCSNLVSISFPDSLIDIGAGAFADTGWFLNKNRGFVYAGNVLYAYRTAYDSKDGYGDPANPIQVTIKEGTVAVAKGAFYGANVEKLTIPASVTYLTTEDIYPAYNVKEFVVSSDNPCFSSKDKFLFSKDGKKLICAPAVTSSQTYKVPFDVTEIGDFAFRFNTNIKSIIIGNNAVVYGKNPFNNGDSERNIVCMEGSAAAQAAKDDDVNRIYLESGISIDIKEMTLGTGESAVLKAQVSPDIADHTVCWSSSDESVVTVDGSGRITAAGPGQAVVTASESTGKKAECTVTVCSAPSSFRLSRSELTIGAGETYALESVLPAGTASKVISYKSSDSKILLVSENNSGCLIKGRKAGKATITAETYNGVKAVCTVTIKNAPESVSMALSQISIGAGETYTIKSILNDGSASAMRKYISSNTDAVDIDPNSWNCTFTGIAPGTSIITVKTYNGKTAKCKVTVKAPPRFFDLDKEAVTIGKGESVTVGCVLLGTEASASRKYRSSNTSVVKMTKTDWVGGFTGNSTGTANVIASTYNGQESKCAVTVMNAPDSVKISRSSMTLKVGETGAIGSTVPDGSASWNRQYRSSNNSVVKMTKTSWVGEFTAVSPGVCWVTVRTYNGKESKCKVTVTN